MTFPAYSEYKDSGVEWLGDVPAHWLVSTLRWYATIQGGLAKGKEYDAGVPTLDLPYLRVANVQDGYVDLSSVNTVTVAASEAERYRLQTGDVLMNEGGDNDKLGRGAVWEGEITHCLHQNHVFAIRTNQHLSPYWLSMFTRANSARAYFYLYSKQSTNLASISSSNVMSCPLPLPPLAEQRQILDFLDHETARIDALVEEQQRLIELLREKRQAVISHAVTKGLDPDVPMKDSGVEWLGEVPAHWTELKLNQLAADEKHSFVNGPFGSDLLTSELVSNGVPVVYIRDIKPLRYTRKSEVFVTADKAVQLEFCDVRPGDVVISKVGDPPGDPAVYPNNELNGIVTQDVIRIRPNRKKVSAEYLAYLLVSNYARAEVDNASIESTRKRIGLGDFKALRFVTPPVAEQQTIVDHIDGLMPKLNTLKQNATDAIRLLQERRSAVISAAVTGKIDVRDWQTDQEFEPPDMLMAAEDRASYKSKEPQ